MAQVVLIAEGTARKDSAYVGDIVSIHEDDVVLDGPGYADFQVVQLPGVSAKAVSLMEQDVTVETRRYSKSGRIEAETSEGVFEEIKTEAKYRANLSDLTVEEVSEFDSRSALLTESTLRSRIKCCTLDQIETLRVVTVIEPIEISK